MPEVNIQHLDKIYDGGVQAVYDFNLDIADGEFIVLVGPSGCGKSTTLRMVAGLEDISAGNLIIDGKDCTRLPPKDRDIAMVFQNYALYGHMTIYENMAFSLTLKKEKKEIIHRKVMAAAEILDLRTQLNKKPRQLSGGQRQRVAMGRAIVRNPKVFLFDEPLSNLDAKLRGSMRRELMLLHKKLNATMMYVTHDQTEALTLADRIVCMSMGHVQQIGKPIDLYEHPANTFVATFIGLPPMNMFDGKIVGGNFEGELFNYTLTAEQKAVLKDYEGKEVILGVRPENITRPGSVKLKVANNENLGMNTLVHGRVESKQPMTVTVSGANELAEGKTVTVAITPKPECVSAQPLEGCTAIEGKVQAERFVSKYVSFTLVPPLEVKKKGKKVEDPYAEVREQLKNYVGQTVYYNIKPEDAHVLGSGYKLTEKDATIRLTVKSVKVDLVSPAVDENTEEAAQSSSVTVINGEYTFGMTVVCKFAEWCNYMPGDEVDIGFDPAMMHIFEQPVTDDNGNITEYGKAII